MTKPTTARCPECGGTIELDIDTEAGDSVFCTDCASELVVERLSPPRLVLGKKARHGEEENEELGPFLDEDIEETGDNF